MGRYWYQHIFMSSSFIFPGWVDWKFWQKLYSPKSIILLVMIKIHCCESQFFPGRVGRNSLMKTAFFLTFSNLKSIWNDTFQRKQSFCYVQLWLDLCIAVYNLVFSLENHILAEGLFLSNLVVLRFIRPKMHQLRRLMIKIDILHIWNRVYIIVPKNTIFQIDVNTIIIYWATFMTSGAKRVWNIALLNIRNGSFTKAAIS